MNKQLSLKRLVEIRDSVSSMKQFKGKGGTVSSVKKMIRQVDTMMLSPKIISLLVAEAEKHYLLAEQAYNERYGGKRC